MKNLLLISAPGAGKGTLSNDLQKSLNYVAISMGSLLRDKAAKGDELGNKIHDYQTKGILVPADIVYQTLKERLQEKDCQNGYILDGFPRSLEQATEYDKILKDLNKEVGIVIVLDISKDILINRITGRRLCKNCDAIYNIYNEDKMPKQDGICDVCGSTLYQRSDDNLESFENRYNSYIEQTQPVIDFYSKKGCLYNVDASKGGEYTHQQVLDILKKLGD